MTKRAWLVVALLLAGCGFFSKSKSNLYSIDRVPGTPRAAAVGAPVGIESIELPPGFDRREIVVRKAGNQLDVRANELWSAGLQELVLHTLAFDLASRLPEGSMILPGDMKPVTMRPVDVVFEELAAGPESRLVLDARWKVGTASHHERIEVTLPSAKSADVAAGMSQALAQLADRIAAAL
jgi:uncharacterized lipoprotein YmbA